jgi:hypothetical protein
MYVLVTFSFHVSCKLPCRPMIGNRWAHIIASTLIYPHFTVLKPSEVILTMPSVTTSTFSLVGSSRVTNVSLMHLFQLFVGCRRITPVVGCLESMRHEVSHPLLPNCGFGCIVQELRPTSDMYDLAKLRELTVLNLDLQLLQLLSQIRGIRLDFVRHA